MTKPQPPTISGSATGGPGSEEPTLRCQWCNTPVPQRATGPGRKRRYCAPPKTCQEDAKRERASRRTAGGLASDLAATEDLVDRLQTYVDRLADAEGIRRSAAEDVTRARSDRDGALAEAEKFQVMAADAASTAKAERANRIDAERQAAYALAERDAAVQAAQAAEARATAAEHSWRAEATTAARATAERDAALHARDDAITRAQAAEHRANAESATLRAAEDTARAAVAALRVVEAERDRLAAARAELDTARQVAPVSDAPPPTCVNTTGHRG